VEDDGFPDDWFVPEADGFPNDWISPHDNDTPAPAAAPQSAPPAPTPPPIAANPVPSNRPAARFDPYEACWSQIPASRAGAFAWAPPIFLSPDPSSPQSIPRSVGRPSPPFSSSPFGQFPPAASPPPGLAPDFPPVGILSGFVKKILAEQARANDPRYGPATGILAGVAKQVADQAAANDPWEKLANSSILGSFVRQVAAQTATNDPLALAANGLLGGTAKLSTASAPAGIPSVETTQSLPPLNSGWLPPSPEVGEPYPQLPHPGYQADPAPPPPSESNDVSESHVFDQTGILPPSVSATPLATTAAASFGESSPSNPSPAGADSNPFSMFLNALNPISPAFAADDEGPGLPPAIARALAQGLIDAATAKRLTERVKVLQDSLDALEDLRDIIQDRYSPRALGRALEPSGVSRPQGYEAHHIVAGNHKRAAVARDVLKRFSIGINDASNGVFLPADESTQLTNGEAIHASLHTKDYFEAVEEALKEATSREDALRILRRIGQGVQSRTFP
jgi:A nuclease family of the HNH/ENDO VII superfamily with conserved AHH